MRIWRRSTALAMTDRSAASFQGALTWICSQLRSAAEKPAAIHRLLEHTSDRAWVKIPSLRTFVHWGD